ncbi:hypothetical protein K501DRAFT_286034 [Backusella circina FSU 941]|nr:hypothetical protein K501DRAFT_286034 [Backusella circina FSU 941]
MADEESYKAAPLLPIGERRYLCVEYPGYVKSLKRALNTMGGEKALAQAIQDDSPVELNFRKTDIFSHPIKGDILPSTRLLVKVTRRVRRHRETGEIVEEDEKEEGWKTEVLGSVTKTLRFRAMADFQRLVPQDEPLFQLKKSLQTGNTENILNFDMRNSDNCKTHLPPPTFSVAEVPFSYNYRQNAPVVRVRMKQPDGSYKIKLLNRSRPNSHEITHVHFGDERVPNQSWYKLHEIVNEKELETKQKIEKLFEERPIWSRFAIQNMLPMRCEKHIKKVLPFISYTLVDGPWRECWVKYGVDPRKDKKYGIYQVMSIRRQNNFDKTHGKKKKRSTLLRTYTLRDNRDTSAENDDSPQKKHIFDGIEPPSRNFFFQVCDITDPDIVHIINNKDYFKDKADKTNGFYYSCVFDRLKDVCRTKHQQFINHKKAEPYPNADDGLKEAVKKEKSGAANLTAKEGDESDKESSELRAIERAARIASSNMQKPNSSKRLKDVVDDYMNHLESHTGDFANDMVDEQDDVQEDDVEFDEDEEEFDEDFDIYEEGVDPFSDNFNMEEEETNKNDQMEE